MAAAAVDSLDHFSLVSVHTTTPFSNPYLSPPFHVQVHKSRFRERIPYAAPLYVFTHPIGRVSNTAGFTLRDSFNPCHEQALKVTTG